MKILFYFLALIFIFSGCQNKEKMELHEKAPSFSIINSRGETIKLSNLKDKVVLLRFWQKGCKSCLAAMPELENLYENFKDKMEIIAIFMGNDKNYVETFQKESNITFFMGIDEINIVAKKYNVTLSPTSFIIDKEGILQSQFIGEIDLKNLENNISQFF